MSKPIYVLNGPNLNLLGVREPHIYGYETLADLEARCRAKAEALGHAIVFRQTNHEGELVDWVQEARLEASAVVINAAAYSHTSIAVLDALKTLTIPIIECHLSNPVQRETFRHSTYIGLVATGVVTGFGADSYLVSIEGAARLLARSA